MQIRAQRLVSGNRTVEPVPAEEIPENWEDLPVPHWIDILADGSDDLRDCLAPLKLHPLILEDCLEPARGATFTIIENALVFSFPTREAWEDPHSVALGVLITHHLVVTVHKEPIPTLDRLLQAAGKTAQRLIGEDTASVLYHVLDALIDNLSFQGLRARSEVEDIMRELDESPDAVTPARLQRLRTKVMQLMYICEDELFGVTGLQTSETQALSIEKHRAYYRDLAAHLDYSIRLIGRLEKRLIEFNQYIHLRYQEKTNSRLQALTIMTMLFTPSVLIAGIYGMNFIHMPELSWVFGYPMAIGLMITVTSGLFLFFWARGWFE